VDCAELVRRTGARVSVHPADAYRLLDPMEHTLWPLPFTIEPLVPDRLLEDGQTIEPAGVMLSVLHTPGHTEGGLCFVDHEQRRVYAGDTLFAGSVGRTDLPGGDMDILVRSITKKLFELEDDYEVYSGHGPMTTIGRERRSNPFVGESNR
jgi:hydroxyacylglutathione hydrolase